MGPPEDVCDISDVPSRTGQMAGRVDSAIDSSRKRGISSKRRGVVVVLSLRVVGKLADILQHRFDLFDL